MPIIKTIYYADVRKAQRFDAEYFAQRPSAHQVTQEEPPSPQPPSPRTAEGTSSTTSPSSTCLQ